MAEVERAYAHVAVLRDRVAELVAGCEPRCILDCTVGAGGHASALLEACPGATLVGLDRDPSAVAAARQTLARFGGRVRLAHARFSTAPAVLEDLGICKVGALVADLGVSSHQLDTAGRGFSFRTTGPLDMRMDPTRGPTLADLLARLDPESLASAIGRLGEERRARRVARAILQAQPSTTQELAAVVRRVVRPAADGLDPATRTFQALRMLVNEELAELDALLHAAPELLHDGGVLAVISFHSLEDRQVKRAIRAASGSCVCPPALPVCMCGRRPTLEPVTGKAVRPSSEEAGANPRARSARLRAARRLRREA